MIWLDCPLKPSNKLSQINYSYILELMNSAKKDSQKILPTEPVINILRLCRDLLCEITNYK